MRCTIILRRIRPAAALPVQLANFTLWFLPRRWVLLDQRKRCPVCVCASHRTGRHWRAVADVSSNVWQRISVRRGHGLLSDFRDAGQLLRGTGVASAGRLLERFLFTACRSEAAMTFEPRNVCRNDSPAYSLWMRSAFRLRRARCTGYVAHCYE